MGWEPEPDPNSARCVDPVGDAREVLRLIKIEDPSKRADTEDAANRVALALSYLNMAMRP